VVLRFISSKARIFSMKMKIADRETGEIDMVIAHVLTGRGGGR
jgi:hypothetical protein